MKRFALWFGTTGMAAAACTTPSPEPERLDRSSARIISVEEIELVPTDLSGATTIGRTVSIDGDVAAVSGRNHAYVFARQGATWTEEADLPVTDCDSTTSFGEDVAVSGDTLAVACKRDDIAGSSWGSVHVYVRSGGQWSKQQKVTATDPVDSANLGDSLDIDGDTLVAGAPGATGLAPSDGAAYVFVRSGTLWTEQAKLIGDPGGSFGGAVSLAGDRVAVVDTGAGPDGTVYVFVRSGTTWTREGTLLPPAGRQITSEVSTDGDTVVVGAPSDDVALSNAGAAFVFTRTGSTWSFRTALSNPNPIASQNFGAGVAVQGSVLIVGASRTRPEAVVFAGSGSTWTDQAVLTPSDVGMDTGHRFGDFVALDGDTAVVGARSHDHLGTGNTGGAYVFVDPRADGEPCIKDQTCASGFCSDGVCCSAACAGPCEACVASLTGGADGACLPIPAGQDPESECIDSGSPSCGDNGVCDGVGACGSYVVGPTGSCVPTVCLDDTDCASGFCAQSGGGPGGVCCDRECSGVCESCLAAEQEPPGVDGVCRPVAAGTDPFDECEPHPTDVCLGDGHCDGAGACRAFAPITTGCGATQCQAGVVSGRLCDGSGTCRAGGSSSCGLYGCAATGAGCATTCSTDADCAADAFCSGASMCQLKQARGEACSADTACQTGFCADGVCCDQRCEQQCLACDVEGSVGTCVPVVGPPRGSRPPCAGDTDECRGECDGTGSTCSFPTAITPCGAPTCNDGQAVEFRCNGGGACVAEPTDCAPYACRDNACLSSCTDDADCRPPDFCDTPTSACVSGATCEGDRISVGPDGARTDCEPYRCGPAGACLTECSSVRDCLGGFVCSVERQCVPVSGSGPDDEGGCGCVTVGVDRSPAPLAWILVAAGAWRARRKTGRPSR